MSYALQYALFTYLVHYSIAEGFRGSYGATSQDLLVLFGAEDESVSSNIGSKAHQHYKRNAEVSFTEICDNVTYSLPKA